MTIPTIAHYAAKKGLHIVGTGDFTHPQWWSELRNELVPEAAGVYKARRLPNNPVRFIISGEVSTIFTRDDRTYRIHHVILAPDLEAAATISDALATYTDLLSDGRPILPITPAELVEVCLEACPDALIFPAHAWTPWYSVFGAFSGFDHIRDCYEDQTHRIVAIETGLSSDPPMNWRVSWLDTFTLVSNSDAHSPWPWRLGREANALNLPEISYPTLARAIRTREGFLFTIEVDPRYGKYHWSGHRNCKVSFSGAEARHLGGICPVCGRRLTKGVEERVEELADREPGYRPPGAPGYIHMLPLHEILATARGVTTLSSCDRAYSALINRFGSEFQILLHTPIEELERYAGKVVARLIDLQRKDQLDITPGYDGVYGRINLPPDLQTPQRTRHLTDS